MAIAINAQSTRQDAGFGASSITFAFNPAISSNDYLTVCVWAQTSGLSTTGVTFNGVALTLLAAATQTAEFSIWGLVAPASGSHNVVVTFSGAAAFAGSAYAASWTGVNQTTPVNTTATRATVNTGYSDSVADTILADLVLDIAGLTTTPTVTLGAGQTSLINAAPSFRVVASSKPGNDGTVSMSGSWSGSASYGHAMVAFISSTHTFMTATESVTSTDSKSFQTQLVLNEIENNITDVESIFTGQRFTESVKLLEWLTIKRDIDEPDDDFTA